MNLAGLSLDRSPAFSVPLRFFVTAPLFGLAAAVLLLLVEPDAILNRWTPINLALTHLFTLGVLGMVMSGALMQLLPVVAGVGLWRVRLSAWVVHLSLTSGTVALVIGLLSGDSLWQRVAVVLLGIWGGWLVLAVSIALWRAHTAMVTVWTLRVAILALGVTVGLGAWQAYNRSYGVFYPLLTDLHAAWGLGGWMMLLVAGVSYQVVPLFQVTPNYPRRFTHALAPLLFMVLVVASFLLLMQEPGLALRGGCISLAVGMLAFALMTLYLQARRKRHITDASLWFWRLGMVSLIFVALFMLLLIPQWGVTNAHLTVVGGILFLLGFALSLISGMLYKIVPFLAWLHLNNRLFERGAVGVTVPHMKAIISEAAARRHLYGHILMLLLTAVAPFYPDLLIKPAALLMAVVFVLLLANLISALMIYSKTYKLIAAPG